MHTKLQNYQSAIGQWLTKNYLIYPCWRRFQDLMWWDINFFQTRASDNNDYQYQYVKENLCLQYYDLSNQMVTYLDMQNL